ncbi:SEC7 domain-containing protein [Entamoeba marina]
MIETSDLDKVAIGQYVGMVNEFNQSVLKALIEHLDFHGIDVDVGLRMVFDTFVMGGESQVVDRVMVTFGNHFFNCNKVELEELQLNPDNVYQIATSIIFLSTESHNPSAKTKAMETFEKFKDVIVNGFGISLNDEMLKGIFERTTKKAFHLPRSSIVDEINELDFVELQAKKRIQMVDSDLRKLRDLTQIRIQPKLFTPYITNTSSMLPVLLYQVFALQTVECIERVYDKLLEEDEVKIFFKHSLIQFI